MRLRTICLGVLAVTCATQMLAAQRSLAVDIAGNGGIGQGGEYYARTLHGERLAISLRQQSAGSKRGTFLEFAADDLSGSRGADAICLPAARGGCIPVYPAFAGFSLSAGTSFTPWSHLELRGGGGTGVYGAYWQSHGTVLALLAQADAAVTLVPHVAAVIGRRGVLIPNYHGDRLTEVPWTVGIRVK
jgi:hypothetical protein